MANKITKLPKIKKACDCCHFRKIRCNGEFPCRNCKNTNLDCTYLAVPKKKGPKRRQSSVATATQPLSSPASTSSISAGSIDPAPSIAGYDFGLADAEAETISLIPDTIFDVNNFQYSPLISRSVIEHYINDFFESKYAIMPIFHRETFDKSLENLHRSQELYALTTAMCATVLLEQPQTGGNPQDGTLTSDFFLQETLRVRKQFNYVENATLMAAQTSFILFAAYFGLSKHNSAWFYLGEAITLLQMLRLHEESTYSVMEDEITAEFSRRTFWLFFITERAYVLQRHRPLTLQRTISLPAVPSDPDASIIAGFLDLVSLFGNFNDNFLSLWNSSTTPASSQQGMFALQHTLQHAIPHVRNRSEIQQADLLISKQWLKTTVWQLCVQKGLLQNKAQNETMTFHYPITIARDTVLLERLLSPKAFEPHDVGILEKVFDIGYSLANVLQVVSPQVSHFEVGPRDYLMGLLRILFLAPNDCSNFGQLLVIKAVECLNTSISNDEVISCGTTSEGAANSDAVISDLDEEITLANKDHVSSPRVATAEFRHNERILLGGHDILHLPIVHTTDQIIPEEISCLEEADITYTSNNDWSYFIDGSSFPYSYERDENTNSIASLPRDTVLAPTYYGNSFLSM